MLLKTHIAFAVFLSLLIIKYFSVEKQILFFSVVILSSLIADIDEKTSIVSKRTRPLSFFINSLFKHRTFFHSLFFPFFIYLVLVSFDLSFIGIPFLVGYLSHLFLDALSKEGIMPFFPLKKRLRGFISSGSFIENFIFVLFFILDCVLVFFV